MRSSTRYADRTHKLKCELHLPVPFDLKESMSCMLSGDAVEALERLKKLMGLPARDLVLECLIVEALHEPEAKATRQRPSSSRMAALFMSAL